MTQEELKQYEQLSQLGKDFYNIAMRNNPGWSHAQAYTYATICIITSKEPPPPGPIEPGTPGTVFREVLKKADAYLEREFPEIYFQVKDFFAKAIDWLKTAVNVTLNKIMEFFK